MFVGASDAQRPSRAAPGGRRSAEDGLQPRDCLDSCLRRNDGWGDMREHALAVLRIAAFGEGGEAFFGVFGGESLAAVLLIDTQAVGK